MNNKYSYFDSGKSLVENVYYLLMIVSIVFIVIQVVIASDSLKHSAHMELTRHTVEQNNLYRVALVEKTDEFSLALMECSHPVSMTRIYEVMMQPDNLEEMSLEQLKGLAVLSDSLVLDSEEGLRLVRFQNDLVNELDQYASFILNGFMFEKLSYESMGNLFLSSTALCAVPSLYMVSYHYYNLHQITVNRSVRQLYDIWWHREQIDKRRNRIEICKTILSDDKREIEFLSQGGLAELSLSPDELRSTIRLMESELADLEKRLAAKIKDTAIKNI